MALESETFPASYRGVVHAFDEYVSRCEKTLWAVFDKRDGQTRSMLKGWLERVAPDTESKAEIIHQEPLYAVSRFLGIDEEGPGFSGMEAKYIEYVNKFSWR